ncbi:MAG: dTDP-4-dehydrorhamnose 3,5-epimerase [Candidatus Omnitrophica bacterium]|nr:dTDP-4-dehydrorhamnose 3,5-epimerase [Candidatus Omnitrophota bacterium]
MKWRETPLHGAYILELNKFEDDRGFFADIWNCEESRSHGLAAAIAHTALSYNKKKGTLRGLHYQVAPHEESKFVFCVRGSIYDVIVDLRPSSPTFRQWLATRLSESSHEVLYVPKNFAHGYQALEDHTEVLYHISELYHPESYRGIRWDEPLLHIEWPLPVTLLSGQDAAHPPLKL